MSDSLKALDCLSDEYRYKDVHIVERDGYIFEFCPDHINANPWGHVAQHRLVVERHLHRFLTAEEFVHHIDGNTMNNSLNNLQIVSRSEHMAIHQKQRREATHTPLTYEIVAQALASGGIKKAARVLGVDQQTIRNNYPDLVAPYKRKSPAKLDDPKWLDQLRLLAADPECGYREAADKLGISAESVAHILKRNHIDWVRKSKTGETHSRYVRKGESYEYSEELLEQIRAFACDDSVSMTDACHELGFSTQTLHRILVQNDIAWVRKPTNRYPVEK